MLIHNDFSELYSQGTAIFCCAPTRRMIRFRGKHYFLSLPHVLFKIKYIKKRDGTFRAKDICVALATSQKPRKVYPPHLPNTASNNNGTHGVCMGTGQTGPTLEEMCKEVVSAFWRSPFNTGLGHGSPLFGSYAAWEEKTKSDPNWVPKASDLKGGSSYAKFCGDKGAAERRAAREAAQRRRLAEAERKRKESAAVEKWYSSYY